MDQVTELWVNKENLRETKIVQAPGKALEPGQVRVAIDKFALTTNNVTYAVAGHKIGYWHFYPAEAPWGKVTVWGYGDVIASESDDIAVGERLYGFFPMASHTVLTVGKTAPEFFVDGSAHRQPLPALYNMYQRTAAEPDFLRTIEEERCLYFPLFITSYLIYDYLKTNDYFGAQQVLVGSVSSKTGYGLAKLLKDDPEARPRVVGLTSAGNASFVDALDCSDQIVTYGNEAEVDAGKAAAYVDMSGNAGLTRSLHNRLQENMVESCMVGITHWEEAGDLGELPGAKPTLFFAPGQISKRDGELGRGVIVQRATEASVALAQKIAQNVTVDYLRTPEALAQTWEKMLDNKVSPKNAIMVSL